MVAVPVQIQNLLTWFRASLLVLFNVEVRRLFMMSSFYSFFATFLIFNPDHKASLCNKGITPYSIRLDSDSCPSISY
jgi:hypothetical protein